LAVEQEKVETVRFVRRVAFEPQNTVVICCPHDCHTLRYRCIAAAATELCKRCDAVLNSIYICLVLVVCLCRLRRALEAVKIKESTVRLELIK
jgi:hypothetical protein